MGSTRLTRATLVSCAVIGCLISTSANQESTGSGCDSGRSKPKTDVTGPSGFVRLSVAEANTLMRVRRSLGSEGAGRPGSLLVYTTGENDGEGVDRMPYSRSARNFMRFGRSQSTGNGDVVCLPVDTDEEPDVTSTEGVDETVASRDGSDETRFTRLGRDHGQYDYNGKPFMRFGKRYARKAGASPEVTGSQEGEVVCFRATVDGREKGKRFMRFGRSSTVDGRQKEERVPDLEEEKRRMTGFGRSSYPVVMGSGADYEKQDDQSKI